jgi:hypothetical protein
MVLLVLALFLIEEQFPFSHFPMYSNIDDNASVVFVADQDGEPVAMRTLFKTSSGTTKKMFNTELKKQVATSGHGSEAATAEELNRAGLAVLGLLRGWLVEKAVPEGTTGLRLYRRVFQAGGAGVAGQAPELLAEVAL